MTPQTTISRILTQFRRYDLTVRRFICRANPREFCYDYELSAARRGSGSRGGQPRNHRYWLLRNLGPDQRAQIEALPKERQP